MRALVASAVRIAPAAMMLVLANAAWSGDCPTNRIFVTDDLYEQEVLSDQPVNSLEIIFAGGCSQGHGSYDLIRGQFKASVGGSCGAYSSLVCTDVYSLVNLPPGASVELRVQLHINGHGWLIHPELPGAPGSYCVSVTDVMSEVENRFCSSEHVDLTIELPVVIIVGEERSLKYSVSASEGFEAGAQVEVRVEFDGLPLGSGIRSCQGFGFDVPVPVERLSWGRVKATYR